MRWGNATANGNGNGNGASTPAGPSMYAVIGWPGPSAGRRKVFSVPSKEPLYLALASRRNQYLSEWEPGPDAGWAPALATQGFPGYFGGAYGGTSAKPGPGMYTGTSKWGSTYGRSTYGGANSPDWREALSLALENPTETGQAAGQAWATYSTQTDPAQQIAVLEARIANLRKMKAKVPFMGFFYDNEIAKLQARLQALRSEQSASGGGKSKLGTAIAVGGAALVAIIVLKAVLS